MESQIRNIGLWADGQLKIDWVRHNMPLLNGLEKKFSKEKPFAGLKIALSVRQRLHICARSWLLVGRRCM